MKERKKVCQKETRSFVGPKTSYGRDGGLNFGYPAASHFCKRGRRDSLSAWSQRSRYKSTSCSTIIDQGCIFKATLIFNLAWHVNNFLVLKGSLQEWCPGFFSSAVERILKGHVAIISALEHILSHVLLPLWHKGSGKQLLSIPLVSGSPQLVNYHWSQLLCRFPQWLMQKSIPGGECTAVPGILSWHIFLGWPMPVAAS